MKYPGSTARGLAAVALLHVMLTGCAGLESALRRDPADARPRPSRSGAGGDASRASDGETRDARDIAAPAAPAEAPTTRRTEYVPATAGLARPSAAASLAVWRRAVAARGLRILVSTDARALWLMRDTTTIMSAAVAVGMHEGFTYRGRRYDFRTPVGQRRVLAKAPGPIWVPPDWHYFEKVVQRGLVPVQLEPGSRVTLEDGSRIEVRGDQVGRVNQFGHFAPFTPGNEIIFDGRIFIPPFGTAQRRIPEILGTHKLEMGDGYLIHGTPEEHTIGEAVSHGCVRMYNEDVVRLYDLVPVGTPVYIF
jgi:hypothetical protein